MDFQDNFIEFVLSKSIDFEGELYFYNIPLKTFEKSDDFNRLWGQILKNEKIRKINFFINF